MRERDEDGAFTDAEKRRLAHLLEALLNLNQPEALVGVLRRVAEIKARSAIIGPISDRRTARRWYNVAVAINRVRQQMLRGDEDAGTSAGGDWDSRWRGDGRPVRDGELLNGLSEQSESE